ncbi:hypothetical protein [Brevibacillus borstelensis]|uniref:hypothetical protein n=1 Tax=Brevibacillus borstelensis TaxID=45462 RepID=UPI00287FBFD6|nr:hypothetical protein [Brevibacillus borstelensis]WNF07213.1 hypothetical protein RFB14_07240 [Brevibacillus borstelensis]
MNKKPEQPKSKPAERGPDGKFIVRFTLPEWLVRKIVLEVRAAKNKQSQHSA